MKHKRNLLFRFNAFSNEHLVTDNVAEMCLCRCNICNLTLPHHKVGLLRSSRAYFWSELIISCQVLMTVKNKQNNIKFVSNRIASFLSLLLGIFRILICSLRSTWRWSTTRPWRASTPSSDKLITGKLRVVWTFWYVLLIGWSGHICIFYIGILVICVIWRTIMELIKERGGNWRGAVSRANQPQERREIGYSKIKMFFWTDFYREWLHL